MTDAGERNLATPYSTTNEPVRFIVAGDRAQAISEVLPSDLQGMYLRAWNDAIGAAMDDCGWSYDPTPTVDSVIVERIRTGRPRVIHGQHIGEQLARAMNSVDRILDKIVAGDIELMAAITHAREQTPVAFEWNISESYTIPLTDTVGTRQLLSSSYLDITSDSDEAAAI